MDGWIIVFRKIISMYDHWMIHRNIIPVHFFVYSPVELYILQPKYDGFSTFKVEKEKDPSLGSFLGQLLPLAMLNLPGGGLQP